MENAVSRRTVRRWLNDWDCLAGNGPPKEVFVGNSGSKPVDGITARMLNKIMLESAYEALPPDLKRVATCRWARPCSLSQALRTLGYTKDQYYYRCDKVVSFIFHHVNGEYDVCKTIY